MSPESLRNTLLLGAGTTGLALAAGALVFCAHLLWHRRLSGMVPLLAGVVLLLPQFLVASVWMDLAGEAGRTRGLLAPWLESVIGASCLQALLWWPLPFLLLWLRRRAILAAIENPEPLSTGLPRLARAVAGEIRRPLIWGAILVLALAVNSITIPSLLMAENRVVAEWIRVKYAADLDLTGAFLAGWPLVALALVPCLLPGRLESGGAGRPRETSRRMMRLRLGRVPSMLVTAAAVPVLALSAFLPLSVLLFSPGTWEGLSRVLVANQDSLARSMALAGAAATGIAGAGLLLRRLPGMRLSWWFFLVPGTLLGALAATIQNHLLGVVTWLFLLLVLILRHLGPGIAGGSLALSGVSPRLLEMSRLEGTGWLFRWRHVILPVAGFPLAILWWLLWLLCLWEVELVILLVPPGGDTLAKRVFDLLHYQHDDEIASLCLLLILAGLLPLVLWRIRRFLPRFLPCLPLLLLFGCGGEADPESRFFARAEVVGHRGTGAGQFNKPRSLAVGTEVFVSDMTGRIQRFDRRGNYLGYWQMPEIERGRPKGMEIDHLGHVVVVEPHYARVNHFTPRGELVARWGTKGLESGHLAFPRSVALHSSGDLFVTEFQQVERIQRFGPLGRDWKAAFGGRGGGVGEFRRPEGIGIDARDRLYVADSCNHRIQVLDAGGEPIASYGRPGAGMGELSYPYDVAVDVDGYQFVCEFGNSRIQVFDPDHRPVEIIGGPGSAPGEFSNPWSVDLDHEGHLWVADSGNHRVQKLVRRGRRDP